MGGLGIASPAAAIAKRVEGLGKDRVSLRRDLHRHAGTAWMEFRSSCLVAGRLRALGFEVTLGRKVLVPEARMGVPPAETIATAYRRAREEGAPEDLLREMEGGFAGVVGRMAGARPGPSIAFRFDIDANVVQESGDPAHRPARAGFASIHANAMRACGHDGHTAVGLGVAAVQAGRFDFDEAVLPLGVKPLGLLAWDLATRPLGASR